MQKHWLLGWAGARLAITGNSARIDRRRVFILPTGAGLSYAGLLVVLLLVAMNYNNNMMFAFTFLLVGIGLNGMWQTHRNLLGLTLELQPPGEIFAGRPVHVALMLEPGKLERHALECSWQTPGRSDPPVLFDALRPTRAEIMLPLLTRGRHTLPPLRLATRYPLGLFNAWTLLAFKIEVLVFPSPAAHPPPLPLAPAGRGQDRAGQDTDDDQDYDGLRTYHNGDPLRLIAWRASARSDTLYSKRLRAETTRQVWLDWKTLEGRSTEERLSILCRWVLEAESRRLNYGLRLPQVHIAPARGARHRNECLRRLALFEVAG